MANEISASFTFKLPEGIEADAKEIQAWVEYCIGYQASINLDNPLHDQSIKAESCEVGSVYPITAFTKSLRVMYKSNTTIMDELATEELNEILKRHSAEDVLAMVKAGRGQVV